MVCHDSAARLGKIAADISDALVGLGVSKSQFAWYMRVPFSTVARWCGYGISPQSRYFKRVCKELGLEPEDYGWYEYGE